MLTHVVLALAFANVTSAAFVYPYTALIGALPIPKGRKFFGAEPLTLRRPLPTGFAGCAGGAGRPFDIDGLSKEEFHELPPAA